STSFSENMAMPSSVSITPRRAVPEAGDEAVMSVMAGTRISGWEGCDTFHGADPVSNFDSCIKHRLIPARSGGTVRSYSVYKVHFMTDEKTGKRRLRSQ